jgi:hypothetical protein
VKYSASGILLKQQRMDKYKERRRRKRKKKNKRTEPDDRLVSLKQDCGSRSGSSCLVMAVPNDVTLNWM